MTEMFGEAWSPMSVPDLAPDDDDDGSTKWSDKSANPTSSCGRWMLQNQSCHFIDLDLD